MAELVRSARPRDLHAGGRQGAGDEGERATSDGLRRAALGEEGGTGRRR